MNKLWRAPFCRTGSTPFHPTLLSPPLLLSSLLSLTVQFPPLASLLLPANCEWSLIIGPPTRLRSEVSQCLREETGMSKCYLRQQTARETEVTHNKSRCSPECTSTGAPPLAQYTHKKKRKKVQMDIIPKFKVEILVFIYSVNVWKKWSLHAPLHQGQ